MVQGLSQDLGSVWGTVKGVPPGLKHRELGQGRFLQGTEGQKEDQRPKAGLIPRGFPWRGS